MTGPKTITVASQRGDQEVEVDNAAEHDEAAVEPEPDDDCIDESGYVDDDEPDDAGE